MEKHEIKVKNGSGTEFTMNLAAYFANESDLKIVDANGLEEKIKEGAPQNKMMGNADHQNKANPKATEHGTADEKELAKLLEKDKPTKKEQDRIAELKAKV